MATHEPPAKGVALSVSSMAVTGIAMDQYSHGDHLRPGTGGHLDAFQECDTAGITLPIVKQLLAEKAFHTATYQPIWFRGIDILKGSLRSRRYFTWLHPKPWKCSLATAARWQGASKQGWRARAPGGGVLLGIGTTSSTLVTLGRLGAYPTPDRHPGPSTCWSRGSPACRPGYATRWWHYPSNTPPPV